MGTASTTASSDARAAGDSRGPDAREPPVELVAIARRHAAAEAAGDLTATLATLEPEPVYELHPVGLKLVGAAAVRRYYEHFFRDVMPRIAGHRMLGEWVNGLGVLQEYAVRYRYDDGAVREFRIIGLLAFGTHALSGERLYADTEFLRILLGPAWDELQPA